VSKAWDFDFIVVGGGGAGLSAAIMARQAGASVMVLEADKKLGGATALSGAVFYAAGTSVQRARGIHDTPEAMFEHVMNLTQWELSPGLMRVMCEMSAPALEWLISLGVNYPPELLTEGGPERILRTHPCKPDVGSTAAELLINAAGAAGVEYALGTRVERLLVEDGRVCGVEALGTELRAPHVLIATGGFGNNMEMIKRLWPTAARHGDDLIAVHAPAPFILGDGIILGEKVGARIVGHDNGLLLPQTGHLGRRMLEDIFLPPWLVVVNKEGRRIMDEMQAYMISSFIVNQQTDMVAYAIYDEAAVRKADADLSWGDPYQSGNTVPAWEEATLRKRIADGTIIKADSIAELAAKTDIDAEALAFTLSKYNADCAQGIDSDFCKDTHLRFPVATPPFYASTIRTTVIGNTNAGLNIDPQCRVLDARDRPIPGLYAAGEVLGCMHGRLYAGGGLAFGGVIIWGRQAGMVVGEAVRAGVPI
jgi:fumarate reductase flavoprotein subunit